MNGPRSSFRSVVIAPVVVGLALVLAGPASNEARGQWVVNPGFGYGGMGFGGWPGGFCGPGFGFGGFGGFGVSTVGFGGFGYGSGFGFGMYPGGFSVLNSPSMQSGLAYQSLATGRMAPYSFNANPFAMAPGFGGGFGGGGFGYPGSYLPGFGPFGFAGEAFYNPYFTSGLTPLAVQSAREELMFRRAEAAAEGLVPPAAAPASRIRVIADPDRPRD